MTLFCYIVWFNNRRKLTSGFCNSINGSTITRLLCLIPKSEPILSSLLHYAPFPFWGTLQVSSNTFAKKDLHVYLLLHFNWDFIKTLHAMGIRLTILQLILPFLKEFVCATPPFPWQPQAVLVCDWPRKKDLL